jgi:hypothetical protein
MSSKIYILLSPSERGNLNHWTVHVGRTTAVQIPETRLCRREKMGKYAIKIVIKHAQT